MFIVTEIDDFFITEDGDFFITEDHSEDGGVGNISVANNLSGDLPISYLGMGIMKTQGIVFESDKRIKYGE